MILIVLLATPISLIVQDTIYVRRGNIFEDRFTEPVETIYVVFPDGVILGFSIHETWRTILPVYMMKQKYGRDIKDAVIVMHNHFASPYFSPRDKALAWYIYRLGFRGSFGIYVTSTKRIILFDYSKAKDNEQRTLN